MAYRYKVVYPQTGEALNPQDWNLNHAELASEFNGYLDRDNLPDDSIGISRVKVGTFVVVHTVAYATGADDVDFGTQETSTQWASTDGTNEIGTLSLSFPVDCVLDVEFSCTFTGDGAVDFDANDLREYAIRFRVTVDGVLAAQSGWVSFGYYRNSIYVVGSLSALAGDRVVKVERQVAILSAISQYYTDTKFGTVYVSGPVIKARELLVIERRR